MNEQTNKKKKTTVVEWLTLHKFMDGIFPFVADTQQLNNNNNNNEYIYIAQNK